MIINHNISAMYANRSLGARAAETQRSIEKLSSGERITRAAEDAAGIAVSEKMRSQIRGLNQASRNIGDAISFIQTTEGYLQNTGDILGRIRELSIQSANGIYTKEDRLQIQVEVDQLVDEVDRIATQAQFNEKDLLTGNFSQENGGLSFHVGAYIDQNELVFIGDMTAGALGLSDLQGTGETLNITDPVLANQAIATLDTALNQVNAQRADLGAFQNRFEIAQKGVDIAAENLQASESRIRDADMASEMVEFTKNQILTQANTAMLAQANLQSQSILQLLG